jgi:hypothetical protein
LVGPGIFIKILGMSFVKGARASSDLFVNPTERNATGVPTRSCAGSRAGENVREKGGRDAGGGFGSKPSVSCTRIKTRMPVSIAEDEILFIDVSLRCSWLVEHNRVSVGEVEDAFLPDQGHEVSV